MEFQLFKVNHTSEVSYRGRHQLRKGICPPVLCTRKLVKIDFIEPDYFLPILFLILFMVSSFVSNSSFDYPATNLESDLMWRLLASVGLVKSILSKQLHI